MRWSAKRIWGKIEPKKPEKGEQRLFEVILNEARTRIGAASQKYARSISRWRECQEDKYSES
jgi:hypothetical protein